MVTAGEAGVFRRLVALAFQRSYVVSVNDGEDIPVRDSVDINAIYEAATAVGECTLIFRTADERKRVGCVFLVFGNAEDGSELVCDYSDNPLTHDLVMAVEAVLAV